MADPPWRFKVWSKKGAGRSAEQHYPVMDLPAIKALPVKDVAAKDCALFLWVIDSMLPQGMEVMDAWGFKFKTVAFTWAKRNRARPGWFTGMGYWTRANPEMCLLGTRGHPKRLDKGVPQLIVAQRQAHSVKPDEAALRIQRLVAGPYLELFARRPRQGWTVWGNEV